MTALALFSAYTQAAGIDSINITNADVIIGLLVGGMLPFYFSALTMEAVGKAAFDMIEEVRRQFREIPGLMEGTAKPDSARCVDISTGAALRQMVVPGLMAVVVPLLVGVILGNMPLAACSGLFGYRCFNGHLYVQCRWCLG